MCLGGLYLKTCLLSFLTLSRQVVLFLIASVDSPYHHAPSNCLIVGRYIAIVTASSIMHLAPIN